MADIVEVKTKAAAEKAIAARTLALFAEHRATLERALSTTDWTFVRTEAKRYMRMIDDAERQVRAAPAAASFYLSHWGENGRGPAIADLMRSAEFHGFTSTAEVALVRRNRELNARMRAVCGEAA